MITSLLNVHLPVDRMLTGRGYPPVFALFSGCKIVAGAAAPREAGVTLRLRAGNGPVITAWDDGSHMVDVSRRPWGATLVALALFATVVLAAGPSGGGVGVAAAAAGLDAAALAKPVEVKPQVTAPAARSGQGIVQSVSARAVVLKELDGGTVRVPVDAKTRVLVNGKPASLRAVKPGFVAVAKWTAGKATQELQAFDLSGQNAAGLAVVESVSADAVVVQEARGSTVTIPVDAKTRVLVDGKPASLRDVKPGYYTVVTNVKGSKGNKPASELRFLRPG
jgi:hypothetical protein